MAERRWITVKYIHGERWCCWAVLARVGIGAGTKLSASDARQEYARVEDQHGPTQANKKDAFDLQSFATGARRGHTIVRNYYGTSGSSAEAFLFCGNYCYGLG